MAKIHQTAIVDTGAEIDEDVEIGAFCIIEKGAKIGAGTKLYNNVTVFSGAEIGKNNEIFPNVVIAALPQDLKFIKTERDEFTRVIIGDNNIIRECVTVNRGTLHSKQTLIGSDCLLMAYSHVAHDCVLGNNIILANSVALGGHVRVDDFAIIGGLAGIHQFVKIGAHCMVGAATMVVKDIPPYTLFASQDLKFCGLNVIGLRRRGFPAETIETLKKAYNFIYKSGLNTSQALEKIKTELPLIPEINYVLEFIEKSERGLSK
jgi:UDP-N-acetylglucosamine acyltransferase